MQGEEAFPGSVWHSLILVRGRMSNYEFNDPAAMKLPVCGSGNADSKVRQA